MRAIYRSRVLNYKRCRMKHRDRIILLVSLAGMSLITALLTNDQSTVVDQTNSNGRRANNLSLSPGHSEDDEVVKSRLSVSHFKEHPGINITGMLRHHEPNYIAFTPQSRVGNRFDDVNKIEENATHQYKSINLISEETNQDPFSDTNISAILNAYEAFIRTKHYSVGLLVSKQVVAKPVGLFSNIEHRSLFFRLRLSEEKKHISEGGPLNPLPDYRNPCWKVTLPSNISDIYKSNPLHKKVYEPTRGSFWKKMEMISMDMNKTIHAGAKARIRCFPYFFILGVTKSGTTDLFRLLREHPEVVEPLTKEPMYWNRVRIGGYKKDMFFRHYVDIFDPLGIELMRREVNISRGIKPRTSQPITGDCSPSYLWEYFGWQNVPGNYHNITQPAYIIPHTLYVFNKNAKMIVLMRNPTDRVYSQYMMWRTSHNPDDFHASVVRSITTLVECFKSKPMRACAYVHNAGKTGRYIAASIYYIYIREWTAIYPDKQFFFIKSEEYFNNRSMVMSPLLDFLKLGKDEKYFQMVDRANPANTRESRASRNNWQILPMRTDTREILNRFFSPFNKMLSFYLRDEKWTWTANRPHHVS